MLPAAAGSSFLLAPQLASGFNTNHTSTTTAAFAKTATLHPLASSLDGLLWKKRRLGVVYTSLAGRRLLGHPKQPLGAAVSEAAGAIYLRRRSKQTKQREKMFAAADAVDVAEKIQHGSSLIKQGASLIQLPRYM